MTPPPGFGPPAGRRRSAAGGVRRVVRAMRAPLSREPVRGGQLRVRGPVASAGSADRLLVDAEDAASAQRIKPAVFSGSKASSLQRTSAICGGLSRGSLATMSAALSTPWFAR